MWYNIFREVQMKGLFGLFMFWVTVSSEYDRIKGGPKAETSVRMGVESIFMSIFGLIFTVGFAVLAYYCFAAEGLIALLAWLFGIICALSALAIFIRLTVASIVYAAYQMKLNRRPIGIVALVISILMSIASIVLAIVAISQFNF